MANPVLYRVIERNVQRQAMPKSGTGDMINEVSRTASRYAKRDAPVRTGKLLCGIGWSRAKPSSYLRLEARVRSTAAHSIFVIEGTQGPIRSLSGRNMPIPADRGGTKPPTILKKTVKGQSANNFLASGVRQSLLRHRQVTAFGVNRIQ